MTVFAKQYQDQMNQEEFQELYERYGDSVCKKLSTFTETALINMIERKDAGPYDIWKGQDNYQIWRVLQIKGSAQSIPPLYNIVTDYNNDYHVRYHACEALFTLAGIKDDDFKGQVQYGLDKNRQPVDRGVTISKLKHKLQPYLPT